ncbi:hypothetical protein EJB05_52742, partial [Eragrostis curvula]
MAELACVRGGEPKSKVACETAAALPVAASHAGDRSARAEDAGAPAESVLQRVRDGVGLAVLFGAALRRDGSTKGSSNPKAAAARAGAPRAGSRRLPAGKAATVVAVLSAGKVVAQERRAPRRGWGRRPAAGARVFASEAVGAAEPVSPKVSCFGAVRSERRAAPPEKQEKERSSGSGCWASVTATVRRLCWNSDPAEDEPEASASCSTASSPESPPDAVLSPPQPVVGLGDVKRLASRRWPETMAGEGRGLGLI